ncbi:MAG: hypothetical protein AB7H81_19725 [Vicinamibacterales bacterium]
MFLDRKPRASDVEIRQALDGVLCRCFVDVRILAAIRAYAEQAASRAGARPWA